MIIHKINATDSTNAYLKNLINKSNVENYTVVSTDFQYLGKGQGANKWISKRGKNLLFSILIIPENVPIAHNAFLNFAISLGIYKVLIQYTSQIKIKWPNDIMAGTNKICGILIENKLKGKHINQSIVGIGLNVNQLNFPESIPNTTSLKKLIGKSLNRNRLRNKLVLSIQKQINILKEDNIKILQEEYNQYLYKMGVPAMFENLQKQTFLGKIIGVSKLGMLQIEHTDGSIQEYANKEIILIS